MRFWEIKNAIELALKKPWINGGIILENGIEFSIKENRRGVFQLTVDTPIVFVTIPMRIIHRVEWSEGRTLIFEDADYNMIARINYR